MLRRPSGGQGENGDLIWILNRFPDWRGEAARAVQCGCDLRAWMLASFCDELDDAGWSGRCSRGREDAREEEGWGSPSAMKSTRDVRRKAALW
jgi:hypothetical protein